MTQDERTTPPGSFRSPGGVLKLVRRP